MQRRKFKQPSAGRSILWRVVALSIAIGSGAITAEVALRWWVSDQARVATLATGFADAPWRLAWVAGHRGPAATAYPIDSFDDVLGWSLRPSLRDVSVGGALVNSNSNGVRGSRAYAIPKPPGRIRILAFGDSYVFGEEVGDDETFASRLEHELENVDVVNMGVHGYGQDQMLLRLRRSASLYQPDVVILGYAPWDEERNLLSFRDYAKPYFDLEGGRLVLKGVPVPAPEEILSSEVYRSKLVDLGVLALRRVRWQRGTLQDESRLLANALLAAFAESVRELGAHLLVVYLPATWGDLRAEPAGREREIEDLCRQEGISFFSLREAFRRSLSAEDLREGHHWGRVEHAAAACALAEALQGSEARLGISAVARASCERSSETHPSREMSDG